MKIQRYSDDYTFRANGINKVGSAAEDVARKEPSISNYTDDPPGSNDNASNSWMNPKVGDWVTLKGPDPGYRIKTPGGDSVMAPGKAGLRHMKFRVEAIQIEHGESELAWVQQGPKGTNFIAFPLNKDGIYIYKHGGYEWPDNDGDGKPDSSGPLHQRDTLPMTWVEMTDENKPKVHRHNRWMGTTGGDITLSYAYAMANNSDHAGSKPVTPEAPVALPKIPPVTPEAPNDYDEVDTKPPPKNNEGEESPDWKKGDWHWFGGIGLELDLFPIPKPKWPHQRREWKRKKRIWNFIKGQKDDEVTEEEVVVENKSELSEIPPAGGITVEEEVVVGEGPEEEVVEVDAGEGGKPPANGWEGRKLYQGGEVAVDGPTAEWQKYIDNTVAMLRKLKVDEESATGDAEEVWKAWMERSTVGGPDGSKGDPSYKAFVKWYIEQHEAQGKSDWNNQKEPDGKWKGERGKGRRYMYVSEAPAEIRKGQSNEALDGELDSEAFDVSMDWSNEKRATVALALTRLSNHLDSINEFDNSDSIDLIVQSILDN